MSMAAPVPWPDRPQHWTLRVSGKRGQDLSELAWEYTSSTGWLFGAENWGPQEVEGPLGPGDLGLNPGWVTMAGDRIPETSIQKISIASPRDLTTGILPHEAREFIHLLPWSISRGLEWSLAHSRHARNIHLLNEWTHLLCRVVTISWDKTSKLSGTEQAYGKGLFLHFESPFV